MHTVKSYQASMVLGCFSLSFFSLSADVADTKSAAFSKREISSRKEVSRSCKYNSDFKDTSKSAKKTTPKTINERVESAAKAAGYTSLCATSLYAVYFLLGKAFEAYRYDPYAVLPVKTEEYLEQARLDNTIFRPCRIVSALGLSTIILVAHYKFKFYNEAQKQLRSLFSN